MVLLDTSTSSMPSTPTHSSRSSKRRSTSPPLHPSSTYPPLVQPSESNSTTSKRKSTALTTSRNLSPLSPLRTPVHAVPTVCPPSETSLPSQHLVTSPPPRSSLVKSQMVSSPLDILLKLWRSLQRRRPGSTVFCKSIPTISPPISRRDRYMVFTCSRDVTTQRSMHLSSPLSSLKTKR